MCPSKWLVSVVAAVLVQLSPCLAAGADLRPLGVGTGAKDLTNTIDVSQPAIRDLAKLRAGSEGGMRWANAARHPAVKAKRACQPANALEAEKDLAILRVTLSRHPDFDEGPGSFVLLKGLMEAESSQCTNAN